MRSKKFSHFEVFKVVITTLYITSGFLMFGTLISNASIAWDNLEMTKSQKYETRETVDCCNCDEID